MLTWLALWRCRIAPSVRPGRRLPICAQSGPGHMCMFICACLCIHYRAYITSKSACKMWVYVYMHVRVRGCRCLCVLICVLNSLSMVHTYIHVCAHGHLSIHTRHIPKRAYTSLRTLSSSGDHCALGALRTLPARNRATRLATTPRPILPAAATAASAPPPTSSERSSCCHCAVWRVTACALTPAPCIFLMRILRSRLTWEATSS